jgi:AcrR family transcriptional regulator
VPPDAATALPGRDVRPRRAPTQRRSRDGVAAILGAAGRLLAEVGVDQLTMTAVAEAAGLSKAALYRYFPTKAAVIRALALDAFASERVRIEELSGIDGEIGATFVIGLRAYLEAHRADPFWAHLRAAIRSDPELSRLDLEDSRTNAALVADALVAKGAGDREALAARLLLVFELADGAIRLLSMVDDAEAERLIDDFCTMSLRHVLP